MASTSDIPSDLRRWAVTELFAVSKRIVNAALMPNKTSLGKICCGKNKQIWYYLTEHVRSRASVCKIRKELHMYRNASELVGESSLFNDIRKLKYQLSTLNTRQSFVEDQVIDLEIKLNSSYFEMKELEVKISEDRKFLGLLIYTAQSFNYKKMQFQFLLKDIDFGLRKIRQGDETSEELKPTSATVPAVCVSNPDSVYIIDLIKCTFSKLSRANSNSFHNTKKEIWEKIEQVLDAQLAFHLITYLKEQSKKNLGELEDLHHESLKELTKYRNIKALSPTTNSITSLELQHQEAYHISKFMQNMKFKNTTASLFEKVTLASSMLKQQIDSCWICDDEIKPLYWTLLTAESKCNSLTLALQNLKLLISGMENSTKHIQQRNDDELIKTQQIYHYQSLIISKRNGMCEFLKQNGTIIGHISKKHISMQEDAVEHFASETIAVENATAMLNANLETERSTISKKRKEFLKLDLNSYRIHNSKLCKKLTEIFKVLPFQNEYSIIKNCLQRVNNITIVTELLKDRKESLLIMESKKHLLNSHSNVEFYDTMFKKQKATLNQASSMIDAGEKQTKLVDSHLFEIQQRLIEWWEQPAQYIPPIQCESRTLKEWNDLLTMLLKS